MGTRPNHAELLKDQEDYYAATNLRIDMSWLHQMAIVAWHSNDVPITIPHEKANWRLFKNIEDDWPRHFPGEAVPHGLAKTISFRVRRHLRQDGMKKKFFEYGKPLNVYSQALFATHFDSILQQECWQWRWIREAKLLDAHHWLCAIHTVDKWDVPESKRFAVIGYRGQVLPCIRDWNVDISPLQIKAIQGSFFNNPLRNQSVEMAHGASVVPGKTA
jgi:hypothetical protein